MSDIDSLSPEDPWITQDGIIIDAFPSTIDVETGKERDIEEMADPRKEGDVPSPVNPPTGCPFHPRCPKAKDICKTEVPKLKKYSTSGKDHYASCHLIDLPERS